ncbi:hypothetical protein KXV85_003588, partial [Aspergillus fumigatus]
RGRGPDRRRRPVPAHPPHLRAAVDAELLGVRDHLGDQPLERLPVAADGDQLAGQTAAHRWPVRLHRDRRRHASLGHDRGRHADGDCAAARHLPDLPEALHQFAHAQPRRGRLFCQRPRRSRSRRRADRDRPVLPRPGRRQAGPRHGHADQGVQREPPRHQGDR